MTLLIDLNPGWVGAGGEGVTNAKTGEPVPRREGVGVSFDCPCGCDRPAFIPFENPLDGGEPHGTGDHWKRTGDTFETLTLRPSILRVKVVEANCEWHGFLTDGEFKSV